MNIFTFLKNMRPLVKAGQYTFNQVLQLYKQQVGPVTGIVRKGIENLFKGISAKKVPWKVKASTDVTKPFKDGEARWILNQTRKEDLFAFKPAEVKIIQGGKGDIFKLFEKYYGAKAAKNLPGEGSVTSAAKYYKNLKNAVDEQGFSVDHPKFNKETIDFSAMRKKDWVSEAIKKGELAESVPPATAKIKGPFPRLDPENDAFIILDETGNKMGRYQGRVKIDKETGKGIHQWWDQWDAKNNKLITDKSKFKFSGAMDETGKEIIKPEGVIEGGKGVIEGGKDITKGGEFGEVISTEPSLTKDKFFGIKRGLSTKMKLNTLGENKMFAAELVSGKNAEFNTLDKAAKREILERLDYNIKKTQSDFAEPVKPEDLASGGRIGFRAGSGKKIFDLVVKHGPGFKKFVDGLFIKASNAIRLGRGIFKNLTQKQRITQHDNLVKTINTFEKKGTLEGAEQYFGINAEKAFIAAQAKVKPQGKIWKDTKGETQGIVMGDIAQDVGLDRAMQKGMALSDAMKTMGYNPGSSKDYFKFEQLVSEGMIGFPREMKEQIIRAKYGDVVNKKLINQMLIDDDPQRLAEVMGTIDEGLIMQGKGMGSEDIIRTLKESFKRKTQAEGGIAGQLHLNDGGRVSLTKGGKVSSGLAKILGV